MTQDIEKYINQFPSAIDPCPVCQATNESTSEKLTYENCLGCCFYYPSHFRVQQPEKRHGLKLSAKSLDILKKKRGN